MAARTPRQALEEFLEPFSRSASLISSRPFLATGFRPTTEPQSLGFAPRDVVVPLDSPLGRRGVGLIASHLYRLVDDDGDPAQRWHARSAGYVYAVVDRDERELVAYHWHPEATGPDFPHLHLSGRLPELELGGGFRPVALGDMHLPTGWMPFAAIVRLLILEFEIAPRRSNWRDELDASEATEWEHHTD